MSKSNTQPYASAAVVCPHLGISEDKQTCLSYPSQWNVCHISRPAMSITLEHQRKVCLTPVHVQCLNFQRTQGSFGERASQRFTFKKGE